MEPSDDKWLFSFINRKNQNGYTTFRATISELDTANAFGTNSPIKSVTNVNTAVINPKLALGKIAVAVATKSAVLYSKYKYC
jgi:hypothetical protein